MTPPHGLLLLTLTLTLHRATVIFGELLQSNSVHRTPAAERPVNDLWCYRCYTMDGNDRCADLRGNHTQLSYKCKDDKRLCMVKRFSYTTSTENSTSTQKMWSLERNCTKHCEPGCIVIGERTKLYACTSCCDTSLCNSGTGRASAKFSKSHVIAIALVALFVDAFSKSSVLSLLHLFVCLSPLAFLASCTNTWMFSINL